MFGFRRGFLCGGLFLGVLLGIGRAEDRPPSAASTEDDSLRSVLEELRREVQLLRGELREMDQSLPEALPMPKHATPKPPVSAPAAIKQNSANTHWAFQPVRSPSPPMLPGDTWSKDDLDRFLLAKLKQKGIQPNKDADRYAIIRRLAFDLTGLPPTDWEIDEFLNDPLPLDEALVKVVDRYLDSPRYGERWGRHWLDIVRYADSVGRNWNAPFTYAFRYRDYVIDSFNADKPYDRFLIEQLAGDLLPAETLEEEREQNIATGFLALGPVNIIEPEGETQVMDRIDEQIDVTTRAMLALTVSCARCHDHKYEPISMRDYYAFAGVFYSTKTLSGQRRGNYVSDDDLRLLPSRDGSSSVVPGVHSMDDISREFRDQGWREVLYTTDPNLAMGAVEGNAQDCPIRQDGDAYKRGEIPQRGDFQFAGLTGLSGIPQGKSGRLQLAQWIASPNNPLTARVMVNRVWRHLFGQGLVRSLDNFGSTIAEPTHAELLDHLAARFAKDWSVKKLIRSLVLSRAYRLSANGQALGRQVDPQNELYWKMNPKRLEVEGLRDSMLFASGQLTFGRPQGIQVAGTGGKGNWARTRSLLSLDSPYRTVYLPVLRSLIPEMYSTFDFPDPNQVQGQRETTTVAPQTLFLMNSDFAMQCARDVSRRLLAEGDLTERERIRIVYLWLLSRPADSEEITACEKLLDSLGDSSQERDAELYRWSVLVQSLMLTGEFRTLF